MVYEVMIREKDTTVDGKPIHNWHRIYDISLSRYLRMMQDSGKYICCVVALYKKKDVKEESNDKNTIDESSKIDS